MPILYNYTGSVDDAPERSDVSPGGLGIKYPFGVDGTAFKSSHTTLEMLKSNLRVLLRTNVNERPMNPTFGIRLREFMFEQITDETKEIIKDSILIAVAK
jgi:hypothetical protein